MSYGFDPYESLALCSGQCQASRYPPATCRCPCGGRNHGILRGSRVIDGAIAEPVYQDRQFYPQYLPEKRMQLLARDLDRLPDLSQSHASENRTLSPARAVNLIPKKGKYRLAKAVGRSFRHALAGYSQEERNRQVIQGLHQQFNEINVESIIDGAYQLFYQRDSGANRPELYELYESGLVDRAAEAIGKHWAIGRPKRS